MNPDEFNRSMDIIVETLKERGYDPCTQVYGYRQKDTPMYITQHRSARDLIQTLDESQIRPNMVKIK